MLPHRIAAVLMFVGAIFLVAAPSSAPASAVTAPTAAISPTSGPAGQFVTVTGSGFAPGRFVYVHYDDNDLVYIARADPDGSIPSSSGFTVPQSSVGDHTVLVVDDLNNQAPPQTYTVTTPTAAISPTSGPAGQFVTVTGSGFTHGGIVYVHYDDNDPVQIGYIDPDGSIHSSSGFTVPQSSVGDHTVLVSDDLNNQAPPQTYTVTTPTAAISPTSGPAGQFVTVTGSGFAPGRFVYVHYDDNDLVYIGYIDPDGSIHSSSGFTVPQSSVGDHTVLVSDGFNNQAPPQTYTVTTPTAAISPTSGPAGQFVTVTGSGFAPGRFVYVHYDDND